MMKKLIKKMELNGVGRRIEKGTGDNYYKLEFVALDEDESRFVAVDQIFLHVPLWRFDASELPMCRKIAIYFED